MEGACPRVSGSQLNNFKGQLVTVIGEIVQRDNRSIKINIGDNTVIMVDLPYGAQINNCSMVQVVGKVVNDHLIEGMNAVPVEGAFDLENYTATLKLMNGKYSALFV